MAYFTAPHTSRAHQLHPTISCQRTCRTLYNLCNDSNLRYLVQMEHCGVNDDLHPGLCYLDCLRILKRCEKAWAMLKFCKPVQVCVPFDSTGIYDFTGGAFLLGTRLYNASHRPMIRYSYRVLRFSTVVPGRGRESRGSAVDGAQFRDTNFGCRIGGAQA
jgi:hypothetical protein